jgi:ATP-binding cassette subfamily C (CFTR/MRP) protein 1
MKEGGCLIFMPAYFPQYLSPVVTFAIFAGLSQKTGTTLNPSTLFTSLSLLLLQAEPLFNMFAGILDFMSALGCVQRIQDFLLQDARLDKRHMINHEGSVFYEKDKSQSIKAVTAKSTLISVRDGAFGWKKTEARTLQNLNFSVERGTFAVILGPVGSGKSTLLRGLLGETPVLDGSVSLETANIAVCEQSPWLTVSSSS